MPSTNQKVGGNGNFAGEGNNTLQVERNNNGNNVAEIQENNSISELSLPRLFEKTQASVVQITDSSESNLLDSRLGVVLFMITGGTS